MTLSLEAPPGEVQHKDVLRPQGIKSAGKPVLVLAILALVAVAAVPLIPNVLFYYLQLVILVFFFATLGTAWSIAGGYGGSHSVGHAAFVGIGAYTSTILYQDFGLSPWLGAIAGVALAAVAALLIGYPCFRLGLRGDYFTLATLAFAAVLYEVANGAVFLTGGSQGIPISYDPGFASFQFDDRRVYYWVAMGMWLVTVTIAYRIRKARLGFEMLAVRDDEAAAARGGISVLRLKLISLMISGAICAAAGTFFAQFYLFLDPSTVLGLALSLEIVLVAVLGGMNSYLGATVGALVLVPTSEVLAINLQGYPGADLAFYGVALVLIMLFMPYGLLGLLRKSPRWRKVIGW